MTRQQQNILFLIRIFVDVVLLVASWVGAYYLRFYTFFPAPEGIPDPIMYWKLIPFICVIWLSVLGLAGFYRRTGQHRSAFVEGLDILQSCVLATLAFIAVTFFIYHEFKYSRVTLIFFALVHPHAIIAGRSLIRKALRFYRRHSPPRAVLVIGGGDTLRHAVQIATAAGDMTASKLIGVIAVNTPEKIDKDKAYIEERGIHCFATPKDWPVFFTENPTQTVIVALPHACYGFLEENLEAIGDQVTDIKLLPDLMRYTRFAAGIELVDGMPVVSVHESPLAGMGSVIKRMIDIAGAIVGIALTAPVQLIVAVAVKLSSPGPVFYKQERMGLDGTVFNVLKFRSMPVDAEKDTGAVWAQKGEERATWFGRFIRRFSLDELPQLFNVLKGDMSLVGPRPERPFFVDQFRRDIPGYMLRHKVKAGITGWAQVNGWRGNTSIEKRIEYDLFYIQNWSVWLDIRIILMTLPKIFHDTNAY